MRHIVILICFMLSPEEIVVGCILATAVRLAHTQVLMMHWS